MGCPDNSFKYLSSEANARENLVKAKAIDNQDNITDFELFKKKAKEFLDYVKKDFNIDAVDVISGVRNGVAKFNKDVFSKIDKIRGYDKSNDKNIKEQLTALNKPIASIKPGVEELFDSNPELADAVYEATIPNRLSKPYKLTNTPIGDPIDQSEGTGLCDGTCGIMAYRLKTQGMPYGHAQIDDKYANYHAVALTEIDGKRFILNQPQLEFMSREYQKAPVWERAEYWRGDSQRFNRHLAELNQYVYGMEIQLFKFFTGESFESQYGEIEPLFSNITKREQKEKHKNYKGVEEDITVVYQTATLISDPSVSVKWSYDKRFPYSDALIDFSSSKEGEEIVAWTNDVMKPRLIEATEENLIKEYKLTEEQAKLSIDKINQAKIEKGVESDKTLSKEEAEEAKQLFQKYVDKTDRQDIEGFKEFVNNGNNQPTIYKSLSEQKKNLSENLLKFLESLNFTTEFKDDLKEDTEFNPLSLTNLLYKAILIRNDFKDEGLLKESAYVAYTMLGKKNKIRTDLIHSIENISNYQKRFDEYKEKSPNLNEYKIKELIVVDFLADAIKNNFEVPKDSYINRKSEYWAIEGSSPLEKRIKYLLQKVKFFLADLFKTSKLSEKQLNDLFDDIAKDVVNNIFDKYSKDVSSDANLTNYEETLAKDPKAKGIVEFFQNSGMLLTGSLALRKAGTIYRSASESLHDLDFTLELNEFKKLIGNKLRTSIDISAKLQQGLDITKEFKKNIETSDFYKNIKKQYPSFKIVKIFNGLHSGELTIQGDIDGYAIDVFVFTTKYTNLSTEEKSFQDWINIFKAKLKMGRNKDIRDFVNYIPFNKAINKIATESGFRHFTFNKSKTLPTESNEQFEEFFENELPKEAIKEIPKINKPEVVSKLIDIMNQLGIKITQAEIEDDTAALADITNRLIKYSRGKLSEDNFTEEVFHFIVEVLEQKNPELFNIFMDKVRGFQVYQDVLNPENGYTTDPNYQNANGRPDIYKLKKEAIAKLLTQKILGNFEENQQKESIFHRLWTLLSDFINSLFGSLSPEKQDEFEEFIDKILNTDYITQEDQQFLEGRTGEFASKRKDIFKETKYRLGSLAKRKSKFKNNQEQRNHFESQRDLFTKQEDPDTQETFYIYNGKKKRRVTTLVKTAISKLTGNFDQSEEKKLLREARMQKGTEVHKEIENILNRYIDQSTGLLKETPDQIPSSKLVSDKIYNQLEQHIQARLSLYPEGTRFSMELPIVNEEEGYAGTADFVAFLPNNDVDILDWKTTGINYVMNNQLIERTDISPFNQKYWRKQLELLKNAMKSQGSKNFRLTRAIPIITDIKEELINKKAKKTPENTVFYVSSIEIGDIDVSKIKKSVLVPISAESETTGIKELDEIITKLWAQYAKLEKTIYPEAEKYKKTIELNKLLKTIRDLQTKKTAESIKDVFDEQFRRIVRLENQEFPFLEELQTNQRFITDEQLSQINSYIQEILEARGFLSIFDNFLPLVTSFYPEKSLRTPDQEAILEEVLKTEGNKKKILFDLDKKVISIYSKLGRIYSIEDINAPDNPRVGNSFLKRFLTLSERPENTIKFAAGAINTLQSQEEENKKEFQEKFIQVQQSFLEYAKNHGGTSESSIKKLYKKIIKEIAILDKEGNPTGKFNKILISKVDDNEKTGYYTTLAEKATEMADWWENREKQLKINGLTGEFLQIQLEKEYAKLIESWLKDNINLEEYQKIFNEKEKEMKEFLSNVKFDEDPFVNEDKKDSYLYSWYNNHSILNSPLALNTDVNWMLRNSDLASKKWESKEWKELNKPENKPLLDLYKLFEEVYNIANEEGMLDDIFASKRFIAKVKGDTSWFTEFLSWSNLSFKYLYLNFGNKLKSLFETDGKDEYFQQKDTITGYRLRSVPVFYKYNTEDTLSDDLFYILNRWATHVYEFKAINKYENLVLGTELVEQLKTEQLNIGSKGNISREIPTTKKEIDTLGDLRAFNDYYLYSKKYDEKEWYHKLGDLLYTYTAFKYLGIHISAISSAYLGGRWSAQLLATTNFSRLDYIEAETLMTAGTIGNKVVPIEKVNAYLNLLREVNPNIHDINENKDESKARMYNKRKFKNIALGGYSFVDNIIQNTMAVVFFKNTTIIDGKFVNINKYVNSKYPDLYDKPISEQIDIQIKIDNEIKELKENKSLLQLAKFENNKLKIEGIDLNSIQGKSQMLQYKNLIRGYIKDAIGNASEKDISLARLSWWMKFVMQFKNWMPRVIGSRVKKLSYDTEKQEYTWGRVNLGFSAFWKLGIQTKIAHTFTSLVPFISDIKESKLLKRTGISTEFSIPLQDLAKEVYHNQILLHEKNNLEFDMAEKEFIDLYIKTYKASIQELNGIMTMAAIVALAAIAAGGADDDDKWKWKIFLKMTAGYFREQKFTFDPDSLIFITATLIPALGAIGDIVHFLEELVGKPVTYIVSESDFLPDMWVEEAEKDLEKSHTLDKGIKTIPFLREGHFWMSVVNPEINGEEYNDIMNIRTPQIK
jgi:hypothetical protein